MKGELSAYDEILNLAVSKIKESKEGRYLSWWMRIDLDDKYTTAKINYELSKAVKKRDTVISNSFLRS